MHHLGRDPPALTAFEADQAVAFHRPQGARQIGFRLAGDTRQFLERAGRLLGDDALQFAIAGRQDPGEGLRRGEPDLRVTRRDAPLAARHGHGARLHFLIERAYRRHWGEPPPGALISFTFPQDVRLSDSQTCFKESAMPSRARSALHTWCWAHSRWCSPRGAPTGW